MAIKAIVVVVVVVVVVAAAAAVAISGCDIYKGLNSSVAGIEIRWEIFRYVENFSD